MTRPSYPHVRNIRRATVSALFVVAVAASSLPAQIAPSAPPAAKPAKSVSPVLETELRETPIEMSPFLVSADTDKGYLATSTLAGTRIKTDLRDVGSAISVITEAFLRDTGARNSEDLLVFTPSTEVGGTRGNFSAVNPDQSPNETPTLIRPNNNTRIRGLGTADNARDFFLTDIPWDSYNTGRVDLQRGPNSILFGLGNPSGIINAGLNQAIFKNGGNVETRFGSYGSYRGSLDYNQMLLKNELAVRIDALYDKTEYEQRPAYNQDKRIYGALRYDPKFLAKNGAHTTLLVNFEAGDIEANRPRSLPPIDRITPWWQTGTYTVPANPATGTSAVTFSNLNRSVYNDWQAYNYLASVPGSGATQATISVSGKQVANPAFQPGISEAFTSGVLMFFPDGSSSAQTSMVAQSNATTKFGIGSSGKIDGSVQGIPSNARFMQLTEPFKLAQYQGRPFYSNYRDYSLTDPSVFDFYHQLLDGPNKLATRNFHAFNAELAQTFLNNRLGFDFAANQQKYRDGQDAIYSDRNQSIGIDINATLPDGSPNPNVGRPMLVGRSNNASSGMDTQRQSFRATIFGELRAEDLLHKSWLTSLLGRHVFTGLYSTDQQDKENLAWSRFMVDPGWGTQTGLGTSQSPRVVEVVQYIGPDLRNTTTSSGLNLGAPTAVLVPTTTPIRYFDSNWAMPTSSTAVGYVNPAAPWVDPFSGTTRTQSENPANYVGWTTYNAQVLNSATGDLARVMSSARRSRYQMQTKGFSWQGFLWNGMIVPTYGYREDRNKIYNASAPITAEGFADVGNPAYGYPSTPNGVVTTKIRTWSFVLHSPQFIRNWLPQGTDVSLTYNQSKNFNPGDVGRVDMLGRPLSPSEGKTKDYGLVISTFHDRLVFKVTQYETAVANSSFSFTGSSWIGNDESRAWVAYKRFQAGLSGNPLYAGANYNIGQSINGTFVQTASDLAKQTAAVAAYATAMPTDFFSAWQMPNTGAAGDDKWQNTHWDMSAPYGQAPAGFTATRDTVSKGTEFEVIVNPARNWTISANAAKTKAVTTNNAGDMVDWIEARNQVWNGPAGDLMYPDGQPSAQTIRDLWKNNVYNPYLFQKYTNGMSVQELRPWRFNLVTNYSFEAGQLKGWSLGGAYRWEDKVAIGYPYTRLTIGGVDTDAPDVTHPIYGPTTTTVNLWAGYERKLTSKIKWRVQFNVANVFGKNSLVPISVQPDGSICSYRIIEKPTWTLTNRFSF